MNRDKWRLNGDMKANGEVIMLELFEDFVQLHENTDKFILDRLKCATEPMCGLLSPLL